MNQFLLPVALIATLASCGKTPSDTSNSSNPKMPPVVESDAFEYEDVRPPVLSLFGPQQVDLALGDPYVEYGASAIDENEGDISHHIQVQGQVNPDVEGAYELTYAVSDQAGNHALSITRDVIVSLQRDSMPYPVRKASSFLDIDLTEGPESLNNTGFHVEGSNGEWSINGFNPRGQSALQIEDLSSRYDVVGAIENEGYFYLELQRIAISIDEEANPLIFFDSEGISEGTNLPLSNNQFLLSAQPKGQPKQAIHFLKASNHRLTYATNNWSRTSQIISPNSHVGNRLDEDYANLLLTWKNDVTFIILDGIVIDEIRGDANIANAWHQVTIGARGLNEALPDAFIRRVRMGTEFLDPNSHLGPKRVAILGDSFAVSGTVRGSPENDDDASVIAINNQQNALTLGPEYFHAIKSSSRGVASWGHQLQAMLLHETGLVQTLFNAACSGHGWVNAPFRDEAGEIPTNYVQAANAYQPHVVVILASVNDLLPHITTDNAGSDLQQDIDLLIDNGPELERILLVQTFGWYDSSHSDLFEGGDAGESWVRRYKTYNDSLKQLDGYRGIVEWVEHDWKEAPPSRKYLIGSNPSNTTTSSNTDYHPSASGHVAMANRIYGPFKRAILSQ